MNLHRDFNALLSQSIYLSIFRRCLFHMLSKDLDKVTAIGKSTFTTDFLNR